MKTLATIILSFIAIIAALVFVLASLCAVNGGYSGQKWQASNVICAVIALAVVVVSMWAIRQINRRPQH